MVLKLFCLMCWVDFSIFYNYSFWTWQYIGFLFLAPDKSKAIAMTALNIKRNNEEKGWEHYPWWQKKGLHSLLLHFSYKFWQVKTSGNCTPKICSGKRKRSEVFWQKMRTVTWVNPHWKIELTVTLKRNFSIRAFHWDPWADLYCSILLFDKATASCGGCFLFNRHHHSSIPYLISTKQFCTKSMYVNDFFLLRSQRNTYGFRHYQI